MRDEINRLQTPPTQKKTRTMPGQTATVSLDRGPAKSGRRRGEADSSERNDVLCEENYWLEK